MDRRNFMTSTVTAAATMFATSRLLSAAEKSSSAPAASAARKRPNLKKGLMYNTFRAEKLSVLEKFKLARDAGFQGIEIAASLNQQEVLAARDATGLAIPSVTGAVHWVRPLSDPNPSVREAGLAGLKQALQDAKAYGASSVLCVPAVVSKEVSYVDAYTRSIAEIKKALPLAESLGVVIAIENVWNQFLLSPLEAVNYVDSFNSPMVRWHFDVGNVVTLGWPEHWIRVLGSRIVKVHVK
jgi:L-ribulose-5-phosphate 3-epimerase